jgi:hypothetical protein
MLTGRLIVPVLAAGILASTGPAGAVTIAQQRSANATVARAERQGQAAERRLAARVLRRPRAAAADAVGPTAQQQALAIALYRAGSNSGEEEMVPAPSEAAPPPAFLTDAARAHAAGCWGQIRSTWSHTIAGGAVVVWLRDINDGWCGNGSTITYGSHNFDRTQWAQYPYCLTNMSFRQGRDGTGYRWAHSGHWGTTGVYTGALLCLPILGSEHATLRIAANGYWDRYDDYGF